MRPLPRFASVALAARCAELLGSSVDALWQHVPEPDQQLCQSAITGAVQTAKTGQKSDSLGAIANEITMLVGTFVIHLHGYPPAGKRLPESVTSLEGEQIQTIQIIIDLAARAARAATASSVENAFDECRDGVSWSYSLVRDWGDHDLEDELTGMIRSLYECCDALHLSDDSKVWWTGYDWNAKR